VYQLFLNDVVDSIVEEEGNRAIKEVDKNKSFTYDEHLAKRIKDLIFILAKEVDSVTDEKLLAAIGKAANE
jgi:hypothetical protein